VELWSRERGLERISASYPPSFYMHLKDPHAHWEMIPGSGSKSAASVVDIWEEPTRAKSGSRFFRRLQ